MPSEEDFNSDVPFTDDAESLTVLSVASLAAPLAPSLAVSLTRAPLVMNLTLVAELLNRASCKVQARFQKVLADRSPSGFDQRML